MIHITVFRLITVLLSPATVPISLKKQDIPLDDLTDITWCKFEEIGKDVHEKTGKYLLTSEATGGDTLMMMIQSCGANFVNEDGEAYIVGNETAEKCVDLYTELVQNDVVKLSKQLG